MKRICEHCKEEFIITDNELSMYEKVGIELPILCFFCRVKIHLGFWYFGKFRKGKSDLSGESLITVFPEKSNYPIYTLHEWHSDVWDAIDYGLDYNPSEPFLNQLEKLQVKVPRPHQGGSKNTGCDWCDDVWNSKNCYLSRSIDQCEDLYYSYRNLNSKNSIDIVACYNCERCFNCLNCHHSYRLSYSRNSRDCVNSSFLFDCRNCQDCFMCWNLRNKSCCIENIQYTREDYNKKLESFNLGSYKEIQSFKKRFKDITEKEVIHRENFNLKNYNSVGNNLTNTKNCNNCFMTGDSEDCFNCVRNNNLKSCIDAGGCLRAELVGNCSSCQSAEGAGVYNLKYSSWSQSRFSEYLDLCFECEYCFGCVGLKKKKYCILNKEYSKEEYEKLKYKIISDMKKNGEYGKFLPYSMSAGPFNFSTAFLYFPDTKKEDILKLGGYWEDIDESHIEGMPTSELPDLIDEVDESICAQALICPKNGWRFNINQNELIFYKQNNIPLPRLHFDERIRENMKYVSVLKSYNYECFYCKKDIDAYYPKDWGYNNIACESCYQQNLN